MGDFYVGQIMMFSGNFAPTDWLPCDGRLLQVSAYQALYSIILNTYGGQGPTTFALPDFRGFFPRGTMAGQNPGYKDGVAGTTQVAITPANLPAHVHPATFVGTPVSAAANLAIQTKLAQGTGIPADGGFLGEGGAGQGAASIYVAPGSTAAGVNLSGGQATVSVTAAGTVAVGAAGGSQPLTIPVPVLAVSFCICVNGIYPIRP